MKKIIFNSQFSIQKKFISLPHKKRYKADIYPDRQKNISVKKKSTSVNETDLHINEIKACGKKNFFYAKKKSTCVNELNIYVNELKQCG